MTVDAPPALRRVVETAVARGVTPGGVVEAGDSVQAVWRYAAGRFTYADDAPPVAPDTVYDLASLTKVLATTMLALRAHAAGRLALESPLAGIACGGRPVPPTIADLLEHAAGFPAHRPYFQSVAGRPAYLARLAAEPLAYAPRTRHEYTDLGFILLGAALEDAGGATLDVQFEAFRDEALPGAEMAFGVREAWRARVAPTGLCPWRGRVIVGHPHDANAAALGGVAGHAGLFGTAAAVGAFARWFLGLWRRDGTASAGIPHALAARAARRGQVPGSSRGLGWDTMLPTSSCGTRLSPTSIGHTGFTGTSLWMDPARDLYVVCLTNRVHASDDRDGIRALRIAVHDTLAAAWDAR